jgi:hypothetical protein
VPHEVSDQTTVLMNPPGPCPVGYTRSLNDGRVGAHVVDNSHETVVEYLKGLSEDRVESRYMWAF